MPTSATAQAGVDTTWQIENVALRVTIEPETGHMSVLQKATGTLWEQELPLPDPHSVSDLEADTHPSVLRYSLTIVHGQPQPLELTIELALIGDEPALEITLASGAGDQVNMRHFGYPAPLYPPKPESYFLAMPEFGNGRYVPVSDERYRLGHTVAEHPPRRPHESSFTRGWFETYYGLLMPWVAVTDGEQGMVVVVMTPWDAVIATQSRKDDEKGLSFPGSVWEPSKNTWGEDRKVRLVFFEAGGHVAACKIYRRIAQQSGDFRTLADKAKKRPDVHKLMGAVDWWGAEGLDRGLEWDAARTPLPFVKEAVAEGMDRGLVERLPQRGMWAPEEIAGVVQLGWLASAYDNYRDLAETPSWRPFEGPIGYCKAPIDEHGAVGPNGEIMPGWGGFRLHCTAKQLECAQLIIPKVLETYPYNARFLDVTASEELVECYSPVHPTTRRSDMANRRELLGYVSEEVGVVTGGELGRYFSVPYVDYHMGTMMAEFLMRWGTSSLADPKDRSEVAGDYLKYGLNPAARVPLFELVYHDCVVNYWWWGDSNEFLHEVAPELTDRKIVMNIIHGTPPQMWPYEHGLHWQIPKEREQMLAIYRNVCKLHEIIGMQEMVSHTFLTPDRTVQQSVFADGTTCTVNFGTETYPVASGREEGKIFELTENDFYVVGPKIEQWRVSVAAASELWEGFEFAADTASAQAGVTVENGVALVDGASGAETSEGSHALRVDLAYKGGAWDNGTVVRALDPEPEWAGPRTIAQLHRTRFFLDIKGDPSLTPKTIVLHLVDTDDGEVYRWDSIADPSVTNGEHATAELRFYGLSPFGPVGDGQLASFDSVKIIIVDTGGGVTEAGTIHIDNLRFTADAHSRRTVIRTDEYLSVEWPAGLYEDGVLGCVGTATLNKQDTERAHIRLAAGSRLEVNLPEWQPDWAGLPHVVVRLDDEGQPIERVTAGDSDLVRLRAPAESRCNYVLLVGSKAQASQVGGGD